MKKYKNSVVLLMVLSLIFSMNVVAKDKYEMLYSLDDTKGLNEKDFLEANAELMRIGKAALKSRGAGSLSLTHYYQDGNQSWSNEIMQKAGESIAAKGCCLTSFAMIETYYGGGDDPGKVNSKLGNSACPFVYTDAASAYNLSITNYKYGEVNDGDSKTFIVGAISLGRPVLVGMHTDTGDSTHFVTAYGYGYGSGSDVIYIHDPAIGRNYTTLDQYLSNYYVDRLYVYAK